MRRATQDDAFSEYVVARRPGLWRSAYLLCGDVQRADDLVQTALMKLYVAWPRLTKADNVDAYVRRIIVNAHVDEARRPWRRETVTLDGHEPAIADQRPEDREALIRALSQLPVGQRRVVVLRHYWGLSVGETARDLGISEGTVKSQCAIALHKLEAALAPFFGEGEPA